MSVRPPTFAELADKQAITEVIHRYCRAMDRMDRALALSCRHAGSTDDPAPLYKGSAEGFIDWLWPVHAAMIATQHCVSNILVDIDGDRAGAEAYRLLTLRVAVDGRVYDALSGGRYLDRFERIGGVWAIRHRLSVRDWSRIEEVEEFDPALRARILPKPNNPEAVAMLPTRDLSDPSCAVLAGL